MKRFSELIVFTGLATAVHAAAIVGIAPDADGVEGAGAQGETVLTLAAAAPDLAGRVRTWDAAPVADITAPAILREPDKITDLPAATEIRKTVPRPDRPAPPVPTRADQRPEQQEAPAPPERALPDAPKPKTAQSDARPSQKAAGSGSQQSSGAAAPAVASAASSISQSALSDWGARIRARIERKKSSPPGRWRSASAVVRITVGRDGALRRLGLVRSSGDARLDDAALRAVQRAGRFPAAPSGFDRPDMTFDLPVSFVR